VVGLRIADRQWDESMPEGSSSKKPIEKTGFNCPVFWRRIGAPVAILSIAGPWLPLFWMGIVDAMLWYAFGDRLFGSFFGAPAFEKSLFFCLSIFWMIGHVLAFWWWAALGLAALQGVASRKAWYLCTAIGFSAIAFYAYVILYKL